MNAKSYNPGDTWEFIDPENGNHGLVWLKEIIRDHPQLARFKFETWMWFCEYEDGSRENHSFDWQTTKASAVEAAKQTLVGMGSNERTMRFKFNEKLKFGRPIEDER